MDKEQTLKILNALGNGVHPVTGEMFPADSPYQHPGVVRALFEAVRAVEGTASDAASRRTTTEAPANTYVRWSAEEEARLAAGFDAGRPVAELARTHNRSRAAIEARLLKLGKIDASALTVQLKYPPNGGSAGAGERR